MAELERGGMSEYNTLLLGIGDVRFLGLLDGLTRVLAGKGTAEDPAPAEYEEEKGGGIGMGAMSSVMGGPPSGATGGRGLLGGPMGVNPGGRLLSGKFL